MKVTKHTPAHGARCRRPLYSDTAKFVGPCLWPSFREAREGVEQRYVAEYNQYTCEVRELYCGGCKLFLGHAFEDGEATGAGGKWRHCVLSLSLLFADEGES